MPKVSQIKRDVVILIPARGGSKAIPSKNLRPFLGKPLIQRSIETALAVPKARVIVNTEDADIATWVKKHFRDVEIYERPEHLADDQTTLDEVAFDMAKSLPDDAGILVTVQPTSPLLSTKSLEKALEIFKESDCDSLISVSEERKLSWSFLPSGSYKPNFEERVNRQQLPPVFAENGALIICRTDHLLETGSRISPKTSCFALPKREAIDIDSPHDWYLAEYFAKGTRLFFVIEANKKIGSGHVHRTLTLAEHFPYLSVEFVLINTEPQFVDVVTNRNYPAHIFSDYQEAVGLLISQDARAIIFDWLDTDSEMISTLRFQAEAKIISFEDLGSGSNDTDLTINELYPPNSQHDHILSGPDYCVMRPEFFELELDKEHRQFDLLIAFGGTDPNEQTLRVLKILETFDRRLKIAVLLGMGAQWQMPLVHEISKASSHDIKIFADLKFVSHLMVDSRVCITSSGRTVYELAICRTKTVCICQNARELTHMFARSNNGIINLGLFNEVEDDKIRSEIISALDEPHKIPKLMLNPRKSLRNVIGAIQNKIGSL